MIKCNASELAETMSLADLPLSELTVKNLDGDEYPCYRGDRPRVFALALAMAVAETRTHDGSGDVYALIEATEDIGEPSADIMDPSRADALVWGSVLLVNDEQEY